MTDAAREAQPESAAAVVRSIVGTTAARLVATEPAAIEDAPDGIHQHRTHVRRLRSVLAGFRDHLDQAAAADLRVRFSEWGGQLGVVRDIEVRAAVAISAMAALGIDDDAMRARLVDTELAEYARAHERLRELHRGERARARMDALARFAADPPTTTAADAGLGDLAQVARAEARRVRRAAKRDDGSIDALHRVRKTGRRLRYVVEALHEASPDRFGERYAELAAAGESVHDTLGDHRDELVFIARLEHERALAGRAGERVGPYDELIARSTVRAQAGLDGLRPALARVRRAAGDL